MVIEALAPEQIFTKETNILYYDFSDFYKEYFPRVYNYVLYRIGNYHDTDDLTSQIMLKIYEKRSLYCSDKAPLYGWVFCIARNTLTDHYRQRGHNSCVPLEEKEDIIDAGSGPEAVAVVNETRSHLHRALNSLNERERDIVVLKFCEGLTNREIAKATGLSESNIGVILFRTMKSLRTIMRAQGMDNRER